MPLKRAQLSGFDFSIMHQLSDMGINMLALELGSESHMDLKNPLKLGEQNIIIKKYSLNAFKEWLKN